MMSIVIVILLNMEFIELPLVNSLKLKGQPFFNISCKLYPSIWIIALEWERSVIAKSLN